MQVQPITDTNFGAKNTFLRKAKHATNSAEIKYFKSLHYEAKARLHYMKFQKAEQQLSEMGVDWWDSGSILKSFLCFIKMAKEKIISVSQETDAFHAYPTRFYAADNENHLPHRYYKTNKLV